MQSLGKLWARMGVLGSWLLGSWVLGSGVVGIPGGWALPLSPGDRLQLTIPDDTYFTGLYEVNPSGELELPFVGSVSVLGQEPFQVTQRLSEFLVERQYFPSNTLKLAVQVVQWAPVEVWVAGELFQPGRVVINELSPGLETASSPVIRGDYRVNRSLSEAIRGAGGVLPTADLTRIRLVRDGKVQTFDLTGMLTGESVTDPPLLAGDQVVVPSAGRDQPELVRPSALTPPGIRIFISSLTVPATSNSTAGITNNNNGVSFPYGSRFSQAALSANCVGGINATNAPRSAALFRLDRVTGETTLVLDRSVEDLVRRSDETDNPFLLPGDGVACYDASVTQVRDIFRTMEDILSPFSLLRTLFK